MQNVPTPSKESRSAGLDGRIQRLEEEVRAMGSEVRKMRTDLAELKAVNSAILDSTAQMLALWRKMAPVEPTLKADFPIRSLDHLKEVDDKIYGKMEKYVPLFKSILGNNLIKNLDQIISPEVIIQLNYSGSRHKYGLANFHNLNSVLQESQKREGYALLDYVKDIRLAFVRQKNKIYKGKSALKKAKPEPGAEPESDSD
ncbi:uncharacterized protein [Drosophila suzukii]|uniref:DUF4806 domain-containing protein n=1 Tax=Drosophila suzukii TaxID=28584 RepID=A0AB40ACK0_DROSZ